MLIGTAVLSVFSIANISIDLDCVIPVSKTVSHRVYGCLQIIADAIENKLSVVFIYRVKFICINTDLK